ncbi:PilC/PilY family type IV pilus protein [Variovorax sp. GT1P44]|uniref:PilC/PilY family type IV pilus protein n=1 Tax=Variovorax sp. GT1P44 TaxID=3443742 RepID=UPI003F4507D2
MNKRIRQGALALLRGAIATAVGLSLGATMIASATSLADQPVFSTSSVPGNLALTLSVEWPTASRTAHTDNYSSASTYLGYFDPNKCYLYQSDTTSNGVTAADKGDSSYFYPQGAATNRKCSNAWSGNFLNWASTPTIDPFRWAMTGGYRVVDTPTTTILQKAYHAGQGLFDDRLLTQSEIAGATPFSTATSLNVSIGGRGFVMQLTAGAPSSGRSFSGNFYQNNPYRTVGGTVVATVTNDSLNHIWNGANPAPGVNPEYFSVTYTGTFTAPETGNYQFQTTSDDGVRVFVNGTKVIDNWTDHGAVTDTSGNVALTSGQSFSVQVDFYQGNGGDQVQLFWKKPSTNSFNLFTSDSSVTNYTMRVKVCDPSLGVALLEANCKAYGSNYKPEGLIQQYSDKMRYSAFGYLNDSSGTRDGAVLRAQQKFVGPTYPVPGALPAANSAQEWSSVDGTMTRNPDAADAATTTSDTGVNISDSGVMNYLNKFGQLIPGGYKNYDPVNELYYAAMRYYRKLGNVPEWSDTSTTGDTNTRRTWIDGFPVIKSWNDPIQYACQRNFVLGIGDIYTWNDKNVPGNTRTDSEPTMPAKVTADTTVNAMTATDAVGVLQGMGANLSGAATGAGGSSYYMAGLAFDANTKDIRPDLTGMQTVQTYWVDVLEQPFQTNNKFYLAAKFGGLNQRKLPAGFDPYTFAGTIPLDWWSTSGDKLTDPRTNVAVDRPDNYFAAGRPDTMLAGLTKAFQRISNEIDAYTTSFSLSTVQVQSTGAASYGAQYDATTWTGIVSGSEIVFDSTGAPSSVTQKWASSTTLETQFSGSGWNSNRRVVTWNGTAGTSFRAANLSSAQTSALDTPYVTGDDSGNYLNYLRGDRSNEKSNSDATKPYRQRSLLLGDIVDAKVTPVGPPNRTYSDAINPGYAAFKTSKAGRSTMVYVGANDGMLHAFNGALTGSLAGTEQFAYVPSAVITGPSGTPQVDGLAQLGSPNYDHHYYVDATAKAFDVDFNTTYGNFTTTNAASSEWHSILIGGLGKGGRSFYAIDITDPDSMTTETAVAGKVLWEFTDPTMGYSFGSPNVIKTQKYGWVVVLTSGYNNTGGGGKSYLYFINPKTGALLEKVATGASSDGLSEASAYVQDFSDNTADAIYAGDLNGQLWRFDVTAARGSSTAYPVGTMLAVVTDSASNAQPITTPPLIEIQPRTRQRFVMFGTGQLLDAVDIGSKKEQSFYGILDGTATSFAAASASPITRTQLTAVTDVLSGVSLPATSLGWYLDLGVDTTTGIAWRVVNNSTTFSGIVSFAPLLTTGDACSPSGQSRLYALNFATGQSVLTNSTAYVSYPNALTDIKFLGVDGTARLVTGDVKANLKKVDFTLPAGQGIRLLNWREVPTVD